MAANETQINGQSYSWSSIKATIMGQLVTGITKISYKESQEIEPVMGAGSKPIGIGYGDTKFEGSMTLHAHEVEALQAASPSGRLQDLPPFPVIVSYNSAGKTVTHRLVSCLFTENGRSASAGDKKIEVELKLFIGDIIWK